MFDPGQSDLGRGLRLYNTLTRTKEDFVALDPKNVRMYVCGPTVYDFAHIGNARPAIVFDVLFRLLRHLYGEDHVTYVRNITDVDDKINARALRDFGAEIEAGRLSLNEAIRKVTEKTANQYHKDVAALGCLPPTFEPRATEFVQARPDGTTDMIGLIQSLIKRGHAYEAAGEVLFDTASMPDYGQLSKRNLDEQQAGARVEVEAHKKNPGDFVLWKLSSPEEPGWDSPWGRGRPGWHIECSAMSDALLWDAVKDQLSPEALAHPHQFDIHGGGLDLIFPHHENEIAQSRCAHGTQVMARYWMHNGFLQVEGQKMSKSLGNFYSIAELLETETFGGRKWPGEVLRLAMLMTHYREPIDFSLARLIHAANVLAKLKDVAGQRINRTLNSKLWGDFHAQLRDDLNTPMALTVLEQAVDSVGTDFQYTIFKALEFLGFKTGRTKVGLVSDRLRTAVRGLATLSHNEFAAIIQSAKRAAHFPSGRLKPEAEILDLVSLVSSIRDEFQPAFVDWEKQAAELRERKFPFAESKVDRQIAQLVAQRSKFIREKNWTAADRIRDELLAQGIQLKDGKDPATGERVTTWEVKR
ncbi:MAG TPA: cysteine--tRNA ligase [Rhizobiaceae bacterium]|nr:cysteine--tRNA ligase [Rhizobiaceae bacterium]